jgi:hypothetical protein
MHLNKIIIWGSDTGAWDALLIYLGIDDPRERR